VNALVDAANSFLFVPASRPDRFERAARSGAGALILDLEDSVAPGQKEAARAEAAAWLGGTQRGSAVVRINAADTRWHDDDMEMVAAAGCSVMLPKADNVDVVRAIRSKLPPEASLIALIETARGVRNLPDLCECGAVARLAFGSLDFALDIGADLSRGSWGLAAARSALVLESHLSGLPAPVDGVTTALRDPAFLGADIDQALAFGFGGKLAIHPDQVPAINAAWIPSEERRAWAERVVAAAGSDGSLADGVLVIDGQMIDQPILARAQRVLASVPSTTNGTS
jgi:citrate lyase subunit beta/citryl-CoA lyase